MVIRIIPALDRQNEVRMLFTEYTEMLIEGDPEVKEYLGVQNYDDEIWHLEEKYGEPDGRLYLAYYGEELAGCVGLRKMDDEKCELKRLYVRPVFRGKHVGSALVDQLKSDAKKIGYSHMLLDTLTFLAPAIKLYEKLGFYEIPKYNNSPLEISVYMQMDLK